MMEVELTEPLPSLSLDEGYRRAWVLARLQSEPVGTCVVPFGSEELSPDQLGALLWQELGAPVSARYTAAGLPAPSGLTGTGLANPPAVWPFLDRRRKILAKAPFISVVICTRERPESLEACLRHVSEQQYRPFEVVVVDNAPVGDAVRDIVAARNDRVPHRYVAEPRPGLSWARNAGLASASGEIVAFLDDDEEPDSQWLAELARGFDRGADIGCVTGMILPARLDTQAQEWFEQSGGHSKGRGFSPAVFTQDGPQSPLYPLPPFGAGGNMAFRRETLVRIGGFDVAMGAGTPTRGGEDSLALTLTLLAGYRIAYEPAAFVRHNHYADIEGLSRQLYGYGVGLTAFYAALLRHRPGVFAAILKLLPRAIGYLRNPGDAGTAPSAVTPHGLTSMRRRGMLAGPAAYLMSVRLQARLTAPGDRR